MFNKKIYRNEILANCQWINNKFVDFYKVERCPYLRKGEGSISGTFELKNRQKSPVSFLFVRTQHIKELVSRKVSELLRIVCLVWEQNKICKIFSKQGGTEQCLGFTVRSFVKRFKKYY